MSIDCTKRRTTPVRLLWCVENGGVLAFCPLHIEESLFTLINTWAKLVNGIARGQRWRDTARSHRLSDVNLPYCDPIIVCHTPPVWWPSFTHSRVVLYCLSFRRCFFAVAMSLCDVFHNATRTKDVSCRLEALLRTLKVCLMSTVLVGGMRGVFCSVLISEWCVYLT